MIWNQDSINGGESVVPLIIDWCSLTVDVSGSRRAILVAHERWQGGRKQNRIGVNSVRWSRN